MINLDPTIYIKRPGIFSEAIAWQSPAQRRISRGWVKVALGSDNKTQLASGDSAKLTVDPDARARKNPTAQPATSPFQLVRSSSRPNRVRPPAAGPKLAAPRSPPLLTSGGGGGHGVAGAARQDAAPPELPQPLAHRPHQRHPGRLPL
jgi:hypothetical protein